MLGCCPGAQDPSGDQGILQNDACSSELHSQEELRYFSPVCQLSVNEPVTCRACFCACVLVGVSRIFYGARKQMLQCNPYPCLHLSSFFISWALGLLNAFFVILTVIWRKPKLMNCTRLFQYFSEDHRIQVFWNWYFS